MCVVINILEEVFEIVEFFGDFDMLGFVEVVEVLEDVYEVVGED